jgi:hypothetical protein
MKPVFKFGYHIVDGEFFTRNKPASNAVAHKSKALKLPKRLHVTAGGRKCSEPRPIRTRYTVAEVAA